MRSISTFQFVVFASVALCFVHSADAASCMEKLPLMAKIAEAETKCISDLNLNATDVPDPSELKDKHFMDRCVNNCTLESLNFYKNGTILKDKILEKLKEEASTDVYEKLEKVIETCIEKANKKHEGKKHDGERKNNTRTKEAPLTKHKGMCNCRRAAKLVHCIVEEDKKLC